MGEEAGKLERYGIWEPEEENEAGRILGNHGRDHPVGRVGRHYKTVLSRREGVRYMSGGNFSGIWLPAKSLETFEITFVFTVKGVIVIRTEAMERYVVFQDTINCNQHEME